jgi:hypothetical protein
MNAMETKTTSKSHTNEELRAALIAGAHLWILDTGMAGGDDVFLERIGETEDDILADILAHFGLIDLPAGWTLGRITPEEEANLRADLCEETLPSLGLENILIAGESE